MKRKSYSRSLMELMTQEELERLDALTDDEIDTSDISPLGEEFWKNAKVVLPKQKQPISIRLDDDILEWFKAQGRGYQSRINAVLRSYMEAARKDTK